MPLTLPNFLDCGTAFFFCGLSAGEPGTAGVERPELGAEDAAFLRCAASKRGTASENTPRKGQV